MTGATLFRGGRVFTGLGYAEALLIDDGRVVVVGPEAEARRSAPTGTESVDLAGRLVVPGLVDAHLHLSEIARVASGLDLGSVGSLEALAAAAADWRDRHPTGPIVGRGWTPDRWGGHGWPDLRLLDRVSPDREIVLYHASGHALVANSAALATAGIDPSSPIPEVPTIGRFADGRPNGLLFEEAMRPLHPIARRAQPIDGPLLRRTLGAVVALGITACGTMNAAEEEVGALRSLATARELPIVVRAYVPLGERDAAWAAPDSAPRGEFAVIGVKGFLDGAFGPRTAWLAEPYADAPSSSGVPVGDDSSLAAALAEATDRGLAIALHAIGDRAVERAARHLGVLDRPDRPPDRIEHGGLTPPGLFPALARAGVTVVVQPGFVWSDAWLPDRLGPLRSRWAYAFRSLRDRGIALAASSDAPYDPVDPWRGLRAFTERRDPSGGSANPDPREAVPPEEALGLYSAAAARAIGDTERGELVPGRPADLVVLRCRDLRSATTAAGSPVAETWVGGRRVYAADAAQPGATL